MPQPSDPPPARRADAERNRAKILAVARTAFAEPGGEASMAEVARRAGVGMATLYRNFPGRRELLEALYVDEVDAICSAADARADATSEATLRAWLTDVFVFLSSKRPLAAELLKQSDRDTAFFKGNRGRVLAAGRPLLDAAQSSGEVRADLTLAQILDMVAAITTIRGDPAYQQPILRAALDGLRLPR